MATITLTVERYAYPRVTAKVDVPARIVGSLAIHRTLFWGSGDAPPMPDKTGNWRISHIVTGMQACPPDIALWIAENRRANAIDFARIWQEACPEFFAACDKLTPETVQNLMTGELRDLAMRAIDQARAIRAAMQGSN